MIYARALRMIFVICTVRVAARRAAASRPWHVSATSGGAGPPARRLDALSAACQVQLALRDVRLYTMHSTVKHAMQSRHLDAAQLYSQARDAGLTLDAAQRHGRG